MTLPRKQIRAAAKAALAGVAGLRVTGLRASPFDVTDLPACEVVTEAETATRLSSDDGARSDHRLMLLLHAATSASTDVQDSLDDLHEACIAALTGDAGFMALVKRVFVSSAEFASGNEGGREITRLDLTLEFITYD